MLHLQLVDEDVGHPDALGGQGHLRDVIKVLGVPLEELVDPVLQGGEKGGAGQLWGLV